MKWFLMSLALAASALISTDRAEAVERGQGPSRDYHLSHGTRFSHGYFYRGRDHSHWTYRYFWSRYGCECFYCPSTSSWYYWSEPRGCYFPVSYINQSLPTPTTTAAAAAASSSAVGPTVIAPIVVTNQGGPAPGPVPAPPIDVPVPVAPPGVSAKNATLGGNVRVGPGN